MTGCHPTGDPASGGPPVTGPRGFAPRLRDSLDRARATTAKARESVLNPSGIRGTAVEVAWLATHIAMYPFGLVEERAREESDRLSLEGLPPIQRSLIISDVEAAGTPIILVHGVIDNHTIFTILRRALSRRGFGRVIALNYSPLSDDVRRVARRLALLVESVCRETGYERVHIIGHSMGGLVSRYYVQRLGGDTRVHTLVTLGSPHSGTAPARLVPHSVARQLRPDSEIVRELQEPAPNCRTRMIAFWSDLDQVMIPKRNARIVHPDLAARNIFVRAVGHMSLPVDGRVVHQICTALAHLDQEGTTVAAGATSISASRARPIPRPRRAVARMPNSAATS